MPLVADLSYLLRMTTPPGVDTDMIMVAQYGLCTMWSYPLRVWSKWSGERTTDNRAYFRTN